MAITQKGPGDVDYPTGAKRKLKLQVDGNPFPYELENDAVNGVSDNIKADGFKREPKAPEAESQIGEDGLGGHI